MDYIDRLDEELAAPAPAPAAPPVKPSTTPAPAPSPNPPAPQPRDPFNPPQPAVDPKPKAKERGLVNDPEVSAIASSIGEAYEDETHESTRNFWNDLPRNREHPFAKHPVLSLYGRDLARSSFEHTSGRTQDVGGHIQPQMQMQIFMQIMQIERQHTNELIELAKDVTVQIWEINREMLEPKLGEPGEMGEPDAPIDEVELTQEVRDQINKRISINAMTQGSAVHAMLTMHHIVDAAINQINPNLLELYNKLSASSVHQYWMMDLPMTIAELIGGVAGTEKIERDENGPKIVASGVCFPILCQELSKGVMELMTQWGLSELDERTLTTVLNHADRTVDEPFLIQIGPELWRRFIDVVKLAKRSGQIPKEMKLSQLIADFSSLQPSQVNEIINAVVNSPEQAKTLLSSIGT